jgi:transcriptional regulator with XRE-family HTH domain
LRKTRETRALLGARFKVMCADAGLSIEETAKVLHVTTRTIRYWISGRVAIPYAAYRLVRILGRYELPDPAWAGWIMHSGRLWSPEGHGFIPGDSSWWGLLVSQARLWREQYDRGRQLDILMLRAGRGSLAASDAAPGGMPRQAKTEPTGAAGRAAQPPGPNLLLSHFGTHQRCELPFSLGKPDSGSKPLISQSENQGVGA